MTGSTTSTQSQASVATVTVNSPTVTLFAGQQMQLAATLKDAAGKTLLGRTVSWTSSDARVATVTGQGMLTAVAPGATTLTASSEGMSGSAAVTVNANLTFTFLTAGGEHNCALTAAGDAYCWGSNVYGELGTGTFTNSSSPVRVAGGLKFSWASAADGRTCGVTTTGAAYCWGEDSGGDSANTTHGRCPSGGALDTCSNVPVPVAPGLTLVNINAGILHTCAVTTSGAGYCWGHATNGELGGDSTASCPTRASYCSAPVRVTGGLTFRTVSPGGFHTCGLTTNGIAYCWGDNGNGTLGIGAFSGPQQCPVDPNDISQGAFACSRVPVPVGGGLTFSALTASLALSCGLTTAGDAYCWGANTDGRVGDGTKTSRSSPTLVVGGIKFAVAAGAPAFTTMGTSSPHTCGVTAAGAAYCWGGNAFGALGDGTTSGPACVFTFACSPSPVAVAGGLNFASVSAGGEHSCGLAVGGIAYCWGNNNYGQLGDGTTKLSAVPIAVVLRP